MAMRGMAAVIAGSLVGPFESPRRRGASPRKSSSGWQRLLGEPRNAVLFVLAAVILVGGGRKFLQAWRTRKAVGRLEDPEVSAAEIGAAVDHGRAGLMELFRLLGAAESDALRDAAGHALSVLWARDELIAEEEKAVVRRGYQVHWRARRRYPRALGGEVRFGVSYGVPFLRADAAGVRPDQVEWSHRIVGARRVDLEEFTPWVAGEGRAGFSIVPADFETDGPHKLIFQARARTTGLTESWDFELPHTVFAFEFDPLLAVDALLATPDDARAAEIRRAVRLVAGLANPDQGASLWPLNDRLALRHVPAIALALPLPCDLAHTIAVELAGVATPLAAGELVLTGQGEVGSSPSTRLVPLGPPAPIPADVIDRPGVRAMRLRLVPDPGRGWSDPDVRSIWPGTVETDWVDVEIVRR